MNGFQQDRDWVITWNKQDLVTLTAVNKKPTSLEASKLRLQFYPKN